MSDQAEKNTSIAYHPQINQWLAQLDTPMADRDYKPGHARIHALLQHFPAGKPRFRIRVAGTNGKGSTAFMLANALHSAGWKTGLYTSPHIEHFNERIRINGVAVDDAALYAILKEMMPAIIKTGASYFEAATCMALYAFSRADVDVEILEAGVGARLDASTAIAADMALITPIGLDHQAWLGDTLTEIAGEKAYAMADCRYAISAPQVPEVKQALQAYRENIAYISSDVFPRPLKMVGKHQTINANLASAAAKQMQADHLLTADMPSIQQAIANTEIPGRLQHLQWDERHLWLDAAHNLHAIHALLPSLPALADPFDVIFIYPREDRDLSAACALLQPYANKIVTGEMDGQGGLEQALNHELVPQHQGRFLILGSFTSVCAAYQWTRATIRAQETNPNRTTHLL